jgi:hypothetical protein
LVQYGLAQCRQADDDGVVVLGHPTYDPRFGLSQHAETVSGVCRASQTTSFWPSHSVSGLCRGTMGLRSIRQRSTPSERPQVRRGHEQEACVSPGPSRRALQGKAPRGRFSKRGRRKAARGKGPVPAPHLTMACKRRWLASAPPSLRLPTAPEA